MFIHKNKSISGFRFKQIYPPSFGAVAGSPHLGVDWASNYEPIYAPCKGKIVQIVYGKQGGWWVHFEETVKAKQFGADKLIHRFAHCEEKTKNLSLGWYDEGDIIGYSGNTGSISTSPHTHHDISKNSVNINNIDNFIDPELYFNTPTMELPQWFKDNKTQEFCTDHKIITDWTDPFRLVPQYVLAEYLRKVTQIPTVKVYMNYNRFTMTDKELQAYKLAVRDVTRFYLPFVDLEFQSPKKTNIELKKDARGMQGEKGINVYILANLDILQGEALNGYANKTARIILIDRDRLTRQDEKDRGMINGFAATLAHEICHIFGHYFSESDQTHHYDYNFTLANYLTKIQWTRLNTEDKLKFNFE
jgi:hypothetical protein